MYDMHMNHKVPLEVEMEWNRLNKNQPNPLNLDEDTISVSLELAPPKEFKGGRHLGRYLVPVGQINFADEDQPRDKSNDVNHLDNLGNRFELMGYAKDAQPMMGTLSDNPLIVNGFAGYHRNIVIRQPRIGQSFYIIDIYDFDTPLDRRVARSQSNHHRDVTLSQSINDYVKEIVNAAESNEVTKDETAIAQLAWRLAEGDKTKKQIEDSIIPKAIKLLGNVYPTFRTYSSQTGKNAGSNTLSTWLSRQGIVPQGIQARTPQQLISQGYLSYCAAEGDNKSTWMRAIANGQELGIPVWIFGYASTRQSDLKQFRDDWIREFEEIKDLCVEWARGITDSALEDGINEDAFGVKFAGFLNQHVKPDNTKGGRPTEVGLVDRNGESIKFDPQGECLTLKD